MTAAHPTSSLHRELRRAPERASACLRLRWEVAPSAVGCEGRTPLILALELCAGEEASVTLDGREYPPALAWLSGWDGRLAVRRVAGGPGEGLVVVDASPLAVAVLRPDQPGRPLHVACDLPRALGLPGGRYELAGA